VGIDWEFRPFLTSRYAPIAYQPGRTISKLAITTWAGVGRCADVARAARCSLVYLLREAFPVGPPLLERALAMSSGRLIFDFDDAIYQRALNYDNPLDDLRDWNRPAKIIAQATKVVAGSNILVDYARRHAPDPERVVMLPTAVDTTRFVPRPKPYSDDITIGWIGTPRNTTYLCSIWTGLAEAARRDPRIRYVFVGANPFQVGEIRVEFRPWALTREIADIQDFDIGIMPLPDDEQTRGKCGFKLIAYMACGLPTIASPVGANCDVVIDGDTGILASSSGEWTEAILRLAHDASLRRTMGASGRRDVEARFSLAVTAPRFVNIIQEAIAG
jgi:glycosyltransferase involved in cell wall biosynthesis